MLFILIVHKAIKKVQHLLENRCSDATLLENRRSDSTLSTASSQFSTYLKLLLTKNKYFHNIIIILICLPLYTAVVLVIKSNQNVITL